MKKSSQPSRNTSSPSKLEKIKDIGLNAISAITEINHILEEHGFALKPAPLSQGQAEELIINIFYRFHTVTTTLLERYDDKATIGVNDEKDAQDLLHGLLKLHFDDIRKEEPMESVAGGTTFMDFLLSRERIGIEVKMGYVGNTELRKQINDDKGNYVAHGRCDILLVFVYDPDHKVRNPLGFEEHLSKSSSGLDTKVFVLPKP